MIDIGALFAVDLDIHEKLVHHRGGCCIFEAFMGHHMAPVAGRIADGEQNGLVERLGFPQSRVAPHPPMHGIFGVL